MCKSALPPPPSPPRGAVTRGERLVRELSATAAVGACGSAKLAGGDDDGGSGGGGGYVDVVGGGAASSAVGELLVVLAKLDGACEFSGPRGRLAAIRDTDQSNSMIRYDKLKL